MSRRRQFAAEIKGEAKSCPRVYGNECSATIGGWDGMLHIRVWNDERTGQDRFSVTLQEHWNIFTEDPHGTKSKLVASGVLDVSCCGSEFLVPAVVS